MPLPDAHSSQMDRREGMIARATHMSGAHTTERPPAEIAARAGASRAGVSTDTGAHVHMHSHACGR